MAWPLSEWCQRRAESQFWQYFYGENFFQHELPLNPSSLTRWRQCLGDKGMELSLSATSDAALESNAVKARDLKRVTGDMTMQEKVITFPSDSRLHNHARERLVRWRKRTVCRYARGTCGWVPGCCLRTTASVSCFTSGPRTPSLPAINCPD
tara:strand:- start:127 stop:582 length:456 start_codon:yes stop_codon:yes gene_type:complete